MIWPTDVRVPLRAVRGLRDVTVGTEEDDQCLREWRGVTCLARLELAPAPGIGGCTCFIAAPCGSCMSTVPECPRGCWRAEEP